MLGPGHPDGWFHNMRNYLREDRIIEELLEEKGVVTAVLLKMLVRTILLLMIFSDTFSLLNYKM